MLSDLRQGLRALKGSPAWTLAAVLVLALGIGANTAVFSVVDTVLLRPLPFPRSDRLVKVWTTQPTRGVARNGVSYVTFQDWRADNQVFASLAAYCVDPETLTGRGEPQSVQAAFATHDFFDVLGVRPWLGRSFSAEESRIGGPLVVVLSYPLAGHLFGAPERALGQVITLEGRGFRVIGVMPRSFAFPPQRREIGLWRPAESDTRFGGVLLMARPAHYLQTVARLRPGVTLAAANADMNAIAAALRHKYPALSGGDGATVAYLRSAVVGDAGPALWLLLAAVGVVLLIACANVAHLQLARAERRRRELALRLALGASPGRLFRQLLIESAWLSLLGGAAGVLLCVWALPALRTLGAAYLPALPPAGLDGAVLAFTLVVALVAGVLFGVLPAWRAARPGGSFGPQRALRADARSGGSETAGRARAALLVAEISLSLVLLVGAGLLITSFWRVLEVPTGMRDPGHLLTAGMELPPARYSNAAAQVGFYDALRRKLAAIPGAQDAGVVTTLPFTNVPINIQFSIPGRADAGLNRNLGADFDAVGPGYFSTLGAPLVAGRYFSEQDGADAPLVVMVNQAMARRYWPGESPVGRELVLALNTHNLASRRIVGIVGDSKYTGLSQPDEPHVYAPFPQAPLPYISVVLRTAATPAVGTAALQRAVHGADPDLVVDAAPMPELMAAAAAPRRFNAVAAGLLAALALLLAALGVYGVVSYAVSLRTREIGVRMALGARPADVLRLVLGEGLRLGLLGIAVGVAAALALMRPLAGLLFGVTASDPGIYLGVAALLLAVVLLACYGPARRALRADPLAALRQE